MGLVTVQDSPFLRLLLLTVSTVSSLPQVNLRVCVCARVHVYMCVCVHTHRWMCGSRCLMTNLCMLILCVLLSTLTIDPCHLHLLEIWLFTYSWVSPLYFLGSHNAKPVRLLFKISFVLLAGGCLRGVVCLALQWSPTLIDPVPLVCGNRATAQNMCQYV